MKRIMALLLATCAFGIFTTASVCHARHQNPPVRLQQSTVQVWVNLKTGVYHYKGERWYGHTKYGQFMTEAEAKRQGYRPTRNGQ